MSVQGSKRAAARATFERRLCERVRALRRANHMTLQTLSEEAGLTLDGLQKIEAGRRTPSATTLAMIARALGVTVGDLLDEKEPKPPTPVRVLTRLVRERPARVQRAAVKVVRALIEAVG